MVITLCIMFIYPRTGSFLLVISQMDISMNKNVFFALTRVLVSIWSRL